MSGAFQNLALSAQPKQGANWANNTTLRVTPEQSEARLADLRRWIDGRTYNKGDLSIKGGRFTAINSHVHFRFLNNDKQTEQDIQDVRQAVYDVFAYKFNAEPARKALQEFLFGPTATHEPLTCDEVYSMLRLVDSGALENATYDELAAFLKKAHDVKHDNKTTAVLDGVNVKIHNGENGANTLFRIRDFIKGYGKHDSVRKTTVNVDSHNEIIRQENEIRDNFQRMIERQCENAEMRDEKEIAEIGARQEEFLGWIDALNERLVALNDAKADPMLIADDFVYLVDTALGSLDLKNAPDSLKARFQPFVRVKGEVQKKCRELREAKKREIDDKVGDMEICLPTVAAIRELLKGKVRELAADIASLRQEVLRHFEGRIRDASQKPSKLLFMFDYEDGKKYFNYLVERVALENETQDTVKRFAKGLEFLKSLEDGGRKLSPKEKLEMLAERLSQVFEERVDRFPGVRGNPALRAALLDQMKHDVGAMSDELQLVSLRVTSEGCANISQYIEDDYNRLQILLCFFNEYDADDALQKNFDRIVRIADPNTQKGRSMQEMLSRLMHVNSPERGAPVSLERKQIRLNQLNDYLKTQYGPAVEPLRLDDIVTNAAQILSDAERQVAKAVDRLLAKGYSRATIDRAFELGKLHAAAVVFGAGTLQKLAEAAIKKHNLGENDHANEIVGDRALLEQLRRLPKADKATIRNTLDLDENELETRVHILVQYPDEAVQGANDFRRGFTDTLKDLGLYDLVDKTLLGTVLKYAMFASSELDKVVGKVIRSVYEAGYKDAVRKAACVTRGRIKELEDRILLCNQYINKCQNEQADPYYASGVQANMASGVNGEFTFFDTADTGTIFKNAYDAFKAVNQGHSPQALRVDLLKRVKRYVVQMQTLKEVEIRRYDALTGKDASLGLQKGEESKNTVESPSNDPDTVTQIRFWASGDETNVAKVDLSMKTVKARLQSDLVDLVRRPADEEGNVEGAPITCVLNREQVNAA